MADLWVVGQWWQALLVGGGRSCRDRFVKWYVRTVVDSEKVSGCLTGSAAL